MPIAIFEPGPEIVVTASRTEQEANEASASVTLIDQNRIERLGTPSVAHLLRLVPSLSVSSSGPAGSQVQVRIRGAEANHTRLFVEGISANDPASGNEPRFELLNADLASRIEVVRGPQSALWGSEAIGGVVAVSGDPPGAPLQALAEAGSFGFARAALRGGIGDSERGLSFGLAGQHATGIDSFDGHGDRDGYDNLAARFSARYRLSSRLAVGASGFAIGGRSEFDGYDAFYAHADTEDLSRNRLAAGRLFAELGDHKRRYALLSGSLLGSANRNYLGSDFLNRTDAGRQTLGLELGEAFGRQQVVLALDHERERFATKAAQFGEFTDQKRTRAHQSVTLEWKGEFKGLKPDIAIRHDIFSRFRDATTLRAGLLAPLGGGFAGTLTYGEGIAQPSFFDLYGYYPGSFVGNPALRPERSRGFEGGLRYRSARLDVAVAAYRQTLRDEIVSLFTADNADGRSHRRGIELDATWRPMSGLRVTAAYAFLDSDEPSVAGQVREQRRPKHSGSIALDGSSGSWSYGASLALVGARLDTDYDSYPAQKVRLSSYALAGARFAKRIGRGIEAELRVANAFDDRYQDVVGYRTEGRSAHAGLRFALGD